MLVVDIDGFDAEAFQAAFAGLANVVAFSADPANMRIFWIANDPDLVAMTSPSRLPRMALPTNSSLMYGP